jgi:uncharacterized cupin superfamily protein
MAMCIGCEKREIGDVLGLKKFDVNVVTLKLGAATSQDHWRSHSDEVIYILEGEGIMISDAGEEFLGSGMTMGFPTNNDDGHHRVNKTRLGGIYLEVGDRSHKEDADYPDVDMLLRNSKLNHKNGTPY